MVFNNLLENIKNKNNLKLKLYSKKIIKINMINIASFDFLSPRITLYQKGQIRHSSKVSGCLTILTYLLCFLFIVNSSLELIQHTKPFANFYKSFKNETGLFPLDSSHLYHFFHFLGDNAQLFPFNSKFIRIKGTRNLGYYISPDSLNNEDHWIYDECEINHEIKDSDNNYFDNSGGACLKYYYNSTEKQYYDINSEKYLAPYLDHGNSNPNNLMYSIFIEKCRNKSIESSIYGEYSCGTEEEMNEFFTHFIAVYLKVVDHNIDIHDYKDPIKNFLNPISAGIIGNTYAVNNLNFNPLIFKNKDRLIFDVDKEIISFMFDTARKNTREKNQDYIILSEFSFWMQNVFEIYERNYKDIPDILAKVGGIVETIINIATLLNYYYHRYMVKFNSIILFREKEKKIFVSGGNNLKLNNLNLHFDNSNLKKSSNKLSLSSNKILNLNKSDFGDISNFNIHMLNLKLENKKKQSDDNIQIISKKKKNFSKSKYNFDFKFNFLTYILPFKSVNVRNCLNIIREFRKKLLSEEHLYRSHLDLYFLEQYCNSEGVEKIEINDIYNKL